MNDAIWRSLLWKEWREHRWKLASLLAIALACVLGCCVISWKEGFAWGIVSGFEIAYFGLMFLAPVYLAMGAAASERSDATLSFLQGMPVRLRDVAVVKLAMGVLTAWLPIALATLVTQTVLTVAVRQDWQGAKRAMEEFERLSTTLHLGSLDVGVLLTPLLVIGSLFVWIAAFGVNRESEVRAAAYGLAAIALTWLAAFATLFILAPSGPSGFWDALIPYVITGMPGGALLGPSTDSVQQTRWGWGLIAFFVVHVPLAWAYVSRFGVVEDSRASATASPQRAAASPRWLGPPRRSTWSALIWKQMRESMPVVLIAFTVAIGLGGMFYVLANLDIVIHNRSVSREFEAALREQSIKAAQVMLIILGCMTGFVAGIGTSISDLQPRLMQFWRSRPINIDQWFGVTVVSNLLLLVAAFSVPAILCSDLMERADYFVRPEAMVYAMLLSYASTLLAACVVRHAVYAAILGLAAFGGVQFVSHYVSQNVAGGAYERPLIACLALLGSALLTVAAWVCVRNDWSLRLS